MCIRITLNVIFILKKKLIKLITAADVISELTSQQSQLEMKTWYLHLLYVLGLLAAKPVPICLDGMVPTHKLAGPLYYDMSSSQ